MDKTFDAVAFMRRRREEIDKEDESLTRQERNAKTRTELVDDPLWQRLRASAVYPSGIGSLSAANRGD